MREVWCAAKSSKNEGNEKWKLCNKCCVFCVQRKNCYLRTCSQAKKEDLCTWRCSPSDWLLGKIDEKARMRAYKERMVEHMEKEGFKEGDGSWEGDYIERCREKYGKKFGKNTKLVD